jgi:hypothetical protein
MAVGAALLPLKPSIQRITRPHQQLHAISLAVENICALAMVPGAGTSCAPALSRSILHPLETEPSATLYKWKSKYGGLEGIGGTPSQGARG